VGGGGREAVDDGEQFVDAVRAGVAGADRLQPVATSAARKAGSAQAPRRCRIIAAVGGDKIVGAGAEQMLASSQGADTSGMPQASASNTRIVGMPGRIVE
jgi:hypothetical protein